MWLAPAAGFRKVWRPLRFSGTAQEMGASSACGRRIGRTGRRAQMAARYIRLKLAMVTVAGGGIFAGTATLLASARADQAPPTPATATAAVIATALADPPRTVTAAGTPRAATSTPTPAATSTASTTVAQTPAATATSRARQSRGS